MVDMIPDGFVQSEVLAKLVDGPTVTSEWIVDHVDVAGMCSADRIAVVAVLDAVSVPGRRPRVVLPINHLRHRNRHDDAQKYDDSHHQLDLCNVASRSMIHDGAFVDSWLPEEWPV